MTICPGGPAEAREAWCGRYTGGEAAPTAVALMRSRYSAFALGRGEYLQATLSSDQRADFDVAEFDAAAGQTKWQGLEIRDISDGGEDDETGAVEFVARYRERGQSIAHHARAMFQRAGGRLVFAARLLHPKRAPRPPPARGRGA